ncbi:MAG: hypothetical protein QOF76_3639, partial [Solirubrobacteraceae bacterium]|nr:hypothetical protein [Solirubrobacteraceae bacterium]
MIAEALAEWAADLRPTAEDLALADAALVDTLAVAHGQTALGTTPAARLAAAAHVLDFDDLHMESTTHISAVCVPATLAVGGGAHEYLVAAGVMARLGVALGWEHYARGWHATCTAGALAVAAGAAAACGADVATAMALAVPAAGGVQRAFGTDAKALQVGFAVEAGLRAADLAAGGGTRAGAAIGGAPAGRPATADPSAVDAWLALVGGDGARLVLDGPAIPGGLAVKLYPCCYALQRPIEAARALPRDTQGPIVVRTPASSVQPLIHARPRTGLEGKFSLQYAIATALLDDVPGFDAFSD